MGDLDPLALGCEQNGVISHNVAGTHGGKADRLSPTGPRPPFATINLLRRTDLNDVVNAGLEAGRIINREIAEHNEAEPERTGEAALSKLFAGLRTAGSASRPKAAK